MKESGHGFVLFPSGLRLPKCRCRLNFGIRAPFVKFVSRPFRILPRLTFQNLCYIARMEVYMVNSPSRPNLRPAAPLSPVECGVMTPLWIWETRLPAHRTAMPTPSRRGGGDGSSPRSWMLWAGGHPPAPSRPNQGKNPGNRASSRLIKPHQGISRHPPKNILPLELLSSLAVGI